MSINLRLGIIKSFMVISILLLVLLNVHGLSVESLDAIQNMEIIPPSYVNLTSFIGGVVYITPALPPSWVNANSTGDYTLTEFYQDFHASVTKREDLKKYIILDFQRLLRWGLTHTICKEVASMDNTSDAYWGVLRSNGLHCLKTGS